MTATADLEKEIEKHDREILAAENAIRTGMDLDGKPISAEMAVLWFSDAYAEKKLLIEQSRPVDYREASTVHFLRESYEPTDRIALVMLNHQKHESIQRITTAEQAMRPGFQKYLRAMNVHGYSIYNHLQALKPDATGRRKEDVDQVRHVYLDIDQGGKRAVGALMGRLDMPKPNWVIETSPLRYQAIWRVDGLTVPRAEQLTRNLAKEFGGDPGATAITQPSRLPGFANKKYPGPPHWVTADRKASGVVQAVAFDQKYYLPDRVERKQEQQRAPERNGNSQERRVPVEKILERAFDRLPKYGRNQTGWWSARQFYSNGYTQGETEQVMRAQYLPHMPETDGAGKKDPYTEREMLASIKSAYSRPPMEPWRDKAMPTRGMER